MKILLIISLLFLELFSAQAFNKLREYKQADGTTFKARGAGNQHLNWVESEDGEVLKYNPKTKNFEYAQIKGNSLKPSGARYEKDNSKRARSKAQVNKIHKEDVLKLWEQKRKEAHEKRKQR